MELRRLKAENRELRRANEILKAAHNHRRLHTACDDLTPVEFEQIYYRQQAAQQMAGVSTQ